MASLGAFDWTGVDTLARAFDDLADRIESQKATREAELLGGRADGGRGDAAELVAALRDAAEDVRAVKQAAQEAARKRKQADDLNEANES